MYDFNVYNFFLRLVPWFLRAEIFNAWLKVLASGLQTTVDALGDFYTATAYSLQFNAQVCYLEQILNETFPLGGGNIYIETLYLPGLYIFNDIEAQDPFYFYNDSEGEPPVYVWNVSDNYNLGIFIVWIPVALAGNELAIAAIVDTYALAGTSYTIQTF